MCNWKIRISNSERMGLPGEILKDKPMHWNKFDDILNETSLATPTDKFLSNFLDKWGKFGQECHTACV